MGLRVGGCPQRDGAVGGWRLYDTVLGGPGGGGSGGVMIGGEGEGEERGEVILTTFTTFTMRLRFCCLG